MLPTLCATFLLLAPLVGGRPVVRKAVVISADGLSNAPGAGHGQGHQQTRNATAVRRVGGTNVDAGNSPTAQSFVDAVASRSHGCCAAAKSIDGDMDTAWQVTVPGLQGGNGGTDRVESLTLDRGQHQAGTPFDTLVINWGSNQKRNDHLMAADYKVLVSDDKTTYALVKSVSGKGNSDGPNRTDELVLTPAVTQRYIKIQMERTTSGYCELNPQPSDAICPQWGPPHNARYRSYRIREVSTRQASTDAASHRRRSPTASPTNSTYAPTAAPTSAYVEEVALGSKSCEHWQSRGDGQHDMGGPNWPSASATKAESLAACKQACDADNACQYITWYEDLGCRTYTSCVDPVDDVPNVVKHIYRKHALGCFATGVKWFTNEVVDMPGQGRTVENNVLGCQARCARTGGCAHFSFWSDGGCHLGGASAVAVPAGSTTVSGPATGCVPPPTSAVPSGSCQVTVYEHWPAGITAGTVGLEAAEQAWGGKFPTGSFEVLQGTGKKPLSMLRNLTSSVKVEGTCCKAYGHTDPNCLGARGNPVESTTQLLAGLPIGVVTPATGLESVWGCNDCAQCVEVVQSCQ